MRRLILVSSLLVLATVTAYWPVHDARFLNFDDNQYITNNPKVFQGLTLSSVHWAFTTFHAANWHPLTWLSHMLDCQIFGDHPAAHHWVNVGFHCANAVLLLLLLWRMTGAFARSAFVVALFALHPLHAESVAWIAERKDVLSTFLGLLALLAYAACARAKAQAPTSMDRKPASEVETSGSTVQGSRLEAQGSGFRPSLYFWLALFFFALSLMSKPMLVTLPFLFLLLDYWPFDRFQRSAILRLVLEKIPFLLLSLASCLITFYAQKAGGAIVAVEDVPLQARLENSSISYLFYLAKTFWPTRLAVFYPYPDHFRPEAGIAAAVALVAITITLLWFARRAPYLLTGWLWYVGMLVPVIGLVQVGSQVAADRYTYLPLVGIFIGVVWGISDLFSSWPHRARFLFPAGAAILLGCLVATFFQVKFWRDSVTLFARALAISSENNPIVHHNLGHALSLSGDQPAAIAHFKEALHYRQDFPAAHFNWGNSVGMQGNVEEAIQHYRDAIRYQPSYEQAHYQLGNAYALQGKLEEAEASFREAIRLKPDYAEALLKLANVLDLKGNTAEAMSNWRAALAGQPDLDEAHYYFAGSLARQKKFPDAIAHFRAAIKANPGYAAACNDLAWILATETKPGAPERAEAVRLAQKACDLTKSSNPMYLDTLAVALSESSRIAEAADVEGKAVAAASASANDGVSKQLRKHLELFRAGKPYHSLADANP